MEIVFVGIRNSFVVKNYLFVGCFSTRCHRKSGEIIQFAFFNLNLGNKNKAKINLKKKNRNSNGNKKWFFIMIGVESWGRNVFHFSFVIVAKIRTRRSWAELITKCTYYFRCVRLDQPFSERFSITSISLFSFIFSSSFLYDFNFFFRNEVTFSQNLLALTNANFERTL